MDLPEDNKSRDSASEVHESSAVTLAAAKPAESPEVLKRRKLFLAISYCSCCLIWGTTWYAIRIAVEPGDGYPPNYAGAIRFVIAFILYMPLWLIFAKRIHMPNRLEVAWIVLAGLLNGMYQCFMYSCETTISGGLASVIMATSPLMVAAIAICTGFEKVRKQTILSFLFCLVGVGMVCMDRMLTASEQTIGIIYALVAALFTSLSNIALKGRGVNVHPIVSSTIFVIATDIPVWIGTFICGEKGTLFPLHVAPFLAVVYMALMSSVVAFLFFLYMMRHMSLMGISTLQFVLPVFALSVDLFLEHRVSLTPQVWAGIAIVLGGVIFSLRRP